MVEPPGLTRGDRPVFEAFALPPSMKEPEWEHLSVATGEVVPDRAGDPEGLAGAMVYRVPRLDHHFVRELTRGLRASGGALSLRSPRDIATVLGRIGGRFLDPGDALRKEALRLLPATAALSSRMAAAVLDGMALDWTTERLVALVDAEFGSRQSSPGVPHADGEMLSEPRHERGPRSGAEGRIIHRVAPSLCVQIVSGSVPGVTVNAMLRSLLVGAPTVVKPGRGDALLPVLFARALAEEDPGLAESLAVLYWPRASSDVASDLIAAADVVVVYGADETVRAVRSLLPVTTRVVAYHHRVSVAVVGRDALSESPSVAMELAEAVSMFDQRGCVCPQLVFVEGSDEDVDAFSEEVARACSVVEERFPAVPFSLEEAAALHQWRAGTELWEATGGGRVIDAGPGSPWAVVVEPQLLADGKAVEAGPRPAPSGPPVGRSIRVRAVSDASVVPEVLGPVGPHLQSVGYAGLAGRMDEFALSLGRTGASRVVPIKHMAFPPAWWIHDGRGPLRELVRWVEVERGLA